MNARNDTRSPVGRWRELLAAAVTYGVGHLIGAHVS
jgi:hypothetical protein